MATDIAKVAAKPANIPVATRASTCLMERSRALRVPASRRQRDACVPRCNVTTCLSLGAGEQPYIETSLANALFMNTHAATGSRAGDRLRAGKERVILLWEARLREHVPAAAREPRLILIDTLPAVLDQLVEAFSPHHARQTATQGSTVATEHGGERVRLTQFRLEDIITEYKLLRQVLFEVLEEGGPLTPDDRNTLNASLDQALSEACAGYALVQSRLRDQLFAIIAHDLRNPLSVVQATATLIQRQPRATAVPRWAARICDNVGRADRMVQDLLDAMRVQTGARLKLHIEENDFVEVVRDTLDQLRVQYGDRFVFEPPEPIRGHFAPDALRRALVNLLTNAVKYGAPSRPITVTLQQQYERALLTVHNHGAHIPAATHESLFRAFQRSETSEASGQRGWGLGLAQARAVTEAHGGSIGVDSAPDTGTTFTIDIPLDARPFQEKPTTPGADGPPPG
ncbi:MAG TPA: HAMP domain-containing sensor histidine kinase [Polyangiaceae bacterium]